MPATVKLPDLPFINYDYVKKVWVNFKASYNANHVMQQDGWNAYLKIRINRIYNNLTDDFFFGKQMKNSKVIMWGGAEHAKIYSDKVDSSEKMEGWLLANNYEPTKGKVYLSKSPASLLIYP